jgi:hypothetical protein
MLASLEKFFQGSKGLAEAGFHQLPSATIAEPEMKNHDIKDACLLEFNLKSAPASLHPGS